MASCKYTLHMHIASYNTLTVSEEDITTTPSLFYSMSLYLNRVESLVSECQSLVQFSSIDWRGHGH